VRPGWLAAGLLLAAALSALGGLAWAQEAPPAASPMPVQAAGVEASGGQAGLPWIWWIAPIGSILALVFAWVFFHQVKRAAPGDERMQEIAQYVREGAYAYLRRQYKVVAIFFVVVSAILAVMAWGFHVQHKIVFVAFLTGGFFSGLCGFLGMKTATMASSRTAQGAKEGLNRGLTVAFRAGAVMGLVVVGFGLLDISMWFLILTKLAPALGHPMSLFEVTVVMLTFGMGASSQALFARVGGGIYTKAADVGADLVGKVEAGIPEDDPRNPATIADNVGDNVGDVAGMGADLYESYCGSILATAALGVSAGMALNLAEGQIIRLLAAPMVLAGIGTILSILGMFMVRTREGASMKQLMGALNLGINGSSSLIVVAALGVCYFLLGDIEGVNWWGVWVAIVAGLAAGVVIGKATEYYTSYDYKPTKDIAAQSETGPATVIIAGIAEGMKSTWVGLLTVMIAILIAFGAAGGLGNVSLGLYGVSIASVGMLATLGITLATDAYGPIADNAGGNAEMTHQPPEVRKRTDALDSLGNTTAATGKGFAIGSAALTALALLAAYVEEVRVGLNREAQATVVSYIPQAARDPQAGLGQVFYVGHRKFATKLEAGGGERAFGAFLAMTSTPRDLPKGPVPGAVLAKPKDNLGDNVMMLQLPLADGSRREIQVVRAREASLTQYMAFYDVTLLNPKVLCGLLAGVLLVFLFSSLTMKAVGRVAYAMVREVRRQFKEIPGIMEGKGKPDYARCVAISTAGAQREMVFPSLLALIVPVGVGLTLDVPGVLGLLAGGLACGFAMAIFMANAGGAWDNAKKYIETGQYGGKGSPNHKAAVVGDTVGDPFKDTSGPCLNILIKLMSMVSVVFAGLIVKFGPQISKLLGLG
jgi:H(+)-translocating pyrophosphatase